MQKKSNLKFDHVDRVKPEPCPSLGDSSEFECNHAGLAKPLFRFLNLNLGRVANVDYCYRTELRALSYHNKKTAKVFFITQNSIFNIKIYGIIVPIIIYK